MARARSQTPWLDTRDGVFYAKWYDPENRQVRSQSLRTRDSVEAEHRFAAFLVHGREVRGLGLGGPTVTDVLDDYFEEHVLEQCADPDRQEDAIAHLKQFFGDTKVDAVDIPASRHYAKMRRQGVIGGGKRRKAHPAADSTIRRELGVLNSAMGHAKRWKRIESIPSIELPHDTVLTEDDEAPYYSHDELTAIFMAAEMEGGDKWPFLQLLYWTGARRRAIEGLRKPQVNWQTRRILLGNSSRQTVQSLSAGAGRETTKRRSKKRKPIVPILTSMEEPLRLIFEQAKGDDLFPMADYYRPYVAICKAAGIDENRRNPHVMRHTRATHLLQAGKSIYDVARLLGDTPATVERVYGHHSADLLANALEG